jgi:hypothetical protein
MTDIDQQAKELLAEHMRAIAKEHNVPFLLRDAEDIELGEEWDYWMDAAHAAVTAALRAAPEGFVLLPTEPTEAMLDRATWEEVGGHCSSCTAWAASHSDARRVYAAMLSAAPTATIATVKPPGDLRTELGEVS